MPCSKLEHVLRRSSKASACFFLLPAIILIKKVGFLFRLLSSLFPQNTSPRGMLTRSSSQRIAQTKERKQAEEQAREQAKEQAKALRTTRCALFKWARDKLHRCIHLAFLRLPETLKLVQQCDVTYTIVRIVERITSEVEDMYFSIAMMPLFHGVTFSNLQNEKDCRLRFIEILYLHGHRLWNKYYHMCASFTTMQAGAMNACSICGALVSKSCCGSRDDEGCTQEAKTMCHGCNELLAISSTFLTDLTESSNDLCNAHELEFLSCDSWCDEWLHDFDNNGEAE